jgi:hypothetical protein
LFVDVRNKPTSAEFQEILRNKSALVAELALRLRELVIAAAPGIREQVRNGYAIYGRDEVALAITVHKAHVNLQFYYGTSVSDPDGLLEGEGKRLRHVTLREPGDLRKGYLKRMVREAVKRRSGGGFGG